MIDFFSRSRRTFLTRTAALAARQMLPWPRLLAAGADEVATGGRGARLRPLLAGQTARSRRYAPEGDGFSIRNGREFFNRPLYGASAGAEDGFRVDAGDLPEFSLFLPGHGGNLRFGLERGATAKWCFEMAEVRARYRAGHMEYSLRDGALLGHGVLLLEVQAGAGGLQALVRGQDLPNGVALLWAFGGASGRRGRSNGDIGCEDRPVSSFFQFDAAECNDQRYRLQGAEAMLESPAGRLRFGAPEGAALHVASARMWDRGWPALAEAAANDEARLVLAGSIPLAAERDLIVRIDVLRPGAGEDAAVRTPAAGMPPAAEAFAARRLELEVVAHRVRVETPDAYLPPALGAMLTATEALWNATQQTMMDGAVAERFASPGWRGPYALDALGQHDRMRLHLQGWLRMQNQEALPAGIDGDEEMRAAADPASHLTRTESLLHTNGEISESHQDRNLAFFDAAVRHLRWTGDAAFARVLWPALLRHMDWEYRLFRRAFPNPDHAVPRERQSLPLYESYACVPGSENLQYNGGGVAHATAANYLLNRATASLARLLNEDPVPFDEEAALIEEAVQTLLWMPAQGAFAEAKDSAAPQTVFSNPALWTVSRLLDAELPTPRQAWQMCAERLALQRPIAVADTDVPPGGFLLASSDWTLAEPSLNRLSMAENAHFALALWQAGLADEAYALLRGNLLDSMFQGLCPGNFHVTSGLDPHRGETQRDAADPLGITARAMVEGLFGVLPDLLRGTLTLRPGFPSEWNEARLVHPEIEIAWRREGLHETLAIVSRLPQPVALTLVLPARTTSDPVVLSNGHAYPFAFDPNATGTPRLVLTNFPPATAWQIDIRWHGRAPIATPARTTCRVGERLVLPAPLTLEVLDDPQGCLGSGGVPNRVGQHAVFARVVEEKCGYWLPIPLDVVAAESPILNSSAPVAETYEPVDLSTLLNSRVTDLLRRSYRAPRSPFCSLALPEHLLGGWTEDDVRFEIDDAGLRAAGGMLKTAFDISFVTASDRTAANCRFLSFWEQDQPVVTALLTGKAHTLYLLLTGTTYPQATRIEHGAITVAYADGTLSRLSLKTPETWWPAEQDYATDDFLFRMDTSRSLPPRVDLRTGRTRLLEHADFRGKGGPVSGGAATLLHLPLHADRELVSVRIECSLHGIVVALLAMTLGR